MYNSVVMTFQPVFRVWVSIGYWPIPALKVRRHLRTSDFLGFIKSVRTWKWSTLSRKGYLFQIWLERAWSLSQKHEMGVLTPVSSRWITLTCCVSVLPFKSPHLQKEYIADPSYNTGEAQPYLALVLLYLQIEYMELLKGERNGKKWIQTKDDSSRWMLWERLSPHLRISYRQVPPVVKCIWPLPSAGRLGSTEQRYNSSLILSIGLATRWLFLTRDGAHLSLIVVFPVEPR